MTLVMHETLSNSTQSRGMVTTPIKRTVKPARPEVEAQTRPTSILAALSPAQRQTVVKFVQEARLGDDFWSYYNQGRGRLSVPAITTSKQPARPMRKSAIEPLSKEAEEAMASVDSVNQFVIFLNALRLYSFYPLASQLEAAVLPERCIRSSLASPGDRRRGELSLCVGIARLRLPTIDDSTGAVTRKWVRVCRFRSSTPRRQSHVEEEATTDPSAVESEKDPLTQPLLVNCDNAHNAKGAERESTPLLKKSLPTTASRTAPSMTILAGEEKQKKKKQKKIKSSVFRRFLGCFCCHGPNSKYSPNSPTDMEDDEAFIELVGTTKTHYEKEVPKKVEIPMPASHFQQPPPPPPPPLPSQFDDDPMSREHHDVIQAVHEHFAKICEEDSQNLGEFVETTIGSLFFDASSSLKTECCGLESRISDVIPSHVRVAMCVTAPRQLEALQRTLANKSFLGVVKNSVFPYEAPRSASSCPSSVLGSVASPNSERSGSASSSQHDSCHVKSPSPEPADDGYIHLEPDDVELFVVVRSTWLRQVETDLQPSGASTLTRQSEQTSSAA